MELQLPYQRPANQSMLKIRMPMTVHASNTKGMKSVLECNFGAASRLNLPEGSNATQLGLMRLDRLVFRQVLEKIVVRRKHSQILVRT
jgi:hypothetical protein